MRKPWRGLSILYGVALIASLSVNVFQARQLGNASGIFGKNASSFDDGLISEGTTVPPLQGRDLDGVSKTIRFDDYSGATVIYVVSPQCGWCEQNAPNIAYLSQHASSFRFFAVSTLSDGIPEFVQRTGLPFPILRDPSPETVRAFRLRATPTTIVVSREGKVIKYWQGAFQTPTKNAVGHFFGISFPSDT